MKARCLPIALVALISLSMAGDACAASQGPVKSLKGWVASHLAEPLAEAGLERAPVFTWIMGWDFQDRRWKLNEFTNQMVHMTIGGAINHFVGREATLFVAVGVEAQQFFFQDHRDWKTSDRIRDVLFYFVL